MMKKAGQDSARPLLIHKFLLQRSRNSAMAMSLFKCLCNYENLIVMHHAERYNDIEVYQSSLHLSLRIFPTRHATSYMQTVTDLLKYLWMCSPAERMIITEYCFTCKTGGSKYTGDDCHMEKFVNIVRDMTYKVFRRGHEKKIESHLLFVWMKSKPGVSEEVRTWYRTG